ncbi:MAG: LLM class flavin-dependent oxidoreductase [Candidatus Rokubacteria bacterium]|nr:LLM class flavin-dependent oxidoreductase [Candidatus Rokubacteria bacterium]MBI3824414.1 LLM class flavin-dependent oxidoreductase [Candidatus Rokubacteria bacterium]
MQAWYLCENPYPFVPDDVLQGVDSVRGSLPNRYCDPKIAAELFQECLDEYLLCDDVGLNIISNEHHAGINCLYGASPLILGILARQTRTVRLLSLGTLITVRPDPVRAAEEYATADVISRGRLEIGFVKSGGSEMASGNANPVGIRERFWEAIDLIVKALSHQDGPFSWEGKHFTHRHVNIWPRPWQQPHPPLWAATGDIETAEELGRRGLINAIFLRGPEGTKRAWTAYRSARKDVGLPEPGPDRFAYMGFTYVGDSDEEGVRVGGKALWFLNTGLKSAPQYSKFLPGQVPPELAPLVYRSALRPPAAVPHAGRQGGESKAASRAPRALGKVTAEQAIAQGLMFAGNPDTVYRQMMDFHAQVGGFEHLILMGRSGFMTHEEAEKGITRFAKEVLPRLREV